MFIDRTHIEATIVITSDRVALSARNTMDNSMFASAEVCRSAEAVHAHFTGCFEGKFVSAFIDPDNEGEWVVMLQHTDISGDCVEDGPVTDVEVIDHRDRITLKESMRLRSLIKSVSLFKDRNLRIMIPGSTTGYELPCNSLPDRLRISDEISARIVAHEDRVMVSFYPTGTRHINRDIFHVVRIDRTGIKDIETDNGDDVPIDIFDEAIDGLKLVSDGYRKLVESWNTAEDNNMLPEYEAVICEKVKDALDLSVNLSWDESVAVLDEYVDELETMQTQGIQYITSKTLDVEGSELVVYWTGYAEHEGKPAWSTLKSEAGIHNGGMFDQVDGIEDIPYCPFRSDEEENEANGS